MSNLHPLKYTAVVAAPIAFYLRGIVRRWNLLRKMYIRQHNSVRYVFFLLSIIGYTIASCLLHSKHQPLHYSPRCLYRLMVNRDPLYL